jgi:glycosyltransferase involved in cell wall biosynthesis
LKIAIIGSRGYPYVYSGYETFVKEVVERWVKVDVQVTVYCHKPLFDHRPREVNGIQLVYLPAIEVKVLSQLSHSLLAFIHACFHNYDVILAVNPANGPFGYLTRLFKIKTAINMDGLEWLRPKWKGLGAKYFKWAARQATKSFDLIINDSEAMRQHYLEHFKTDSIVIAYGSKVRQSQSPELIKKWRLEPNDYFLIVGRMVPDNNAKLIAEAFIKSDSKRKLVIVGDVPFQDEYSRQLKAMGTQDDRLIFTGYITDPNELAELYHHSYIYLHGHEFGGTNPTMLKAMGYGCAIAALDTPFNQEMLQAGKYGQYFQKNESSIIGLITQLDQNPGEVLRLKKISREGITEKYTWEYVADAYLRAFQELK